VIKRPFAFLALLASAGAMASCSREASNQNPPTPVGIAIVQTFESGSEARYSANITPYSQVELAFKSGGYVESIRQVKGADGRMRDLQPGDVVEAGTILAQVRQDDYTVKVDQARMQLAQAKGALESARSQLVKAETAANQSQLDHTRAKNLFETQSLTKSDYDTAKTRLDADQASVAAARSQVDAAQAQVGAAAEAVKSAELALADATLKSPLDAVVLKRSVEVGSLVGLGTVGFALADTSSVKAVFGVPDTMMELVTLGAWQEITSETLPGLKGRITAISPSADPKSRTFSVEVTIPNPRGLLKPGMIASLNLVGAKRVESVPVIPLSAVVRPPQNPAGYAVFVVEDQGGKSLARMRNVELGEAYGNQIGVKSGLNLTERVITTGATLVKDGWEVKVIR
jgi:multidrug efflux pump subunit AcrA (membrane-fusion protein)